MFDSELNIKIEELIAKLSMEEENYVNGIRSHKDYQTLRTIRNNIHDIKQELERLYSLQGEPKKNS